VGRIGQTREVGVEAEGGAVIGLEGLEEAHGVLQARVGDGDLGVVGAEHASVEIDVHGRDGSGAWAGCGAGPR